MNSNTARRNAQKAAYNSANYARFSIHVPKGRKAILDERVASNNESINVFINRLIAADLGMTLEEWKAPSSDTAL